jgi:hypothetical protein
VAKTTQIRYRSDISFDERSAAISESGTGPRVSVAAFAPPGAELIVRLVPAIARQVTSKVIGPRSVISTARVVAAVVGAVGVEADITSVKAMAYTCDAWSERQEERYRPFAAMKAPADPWAAAAAYPCVEAAGVLIDACLDLLSVPGGSLSLRPSWMDLPVEWYVQGAVAFRQQQTAAVIRYSRSADVDWKRDEEWSGNDVIIRRIAAEVLEMSEKAATVLAGAQLPPRRWAAITDIG